MSTFINRNRSTRLVKTKEDIAAGLSRTFDEMANAMRNFEASRLNDPINNGWSAFEHFEHIIQSNKPIGQLLHAPKFALRVFGTAKQSASRDEIIGRYQQSLTEGAKASGPYIPKKKEVDELEPTLYYWEQLKGKLLSGLKRWTEEDLDKYRAPHPILGKLTVREMMYFTIYHNGHHLIRIQEGQLN